MTKIQRKVEVPEFIDVVDVLGPKDLYLELIKSNTDVKISMNGYLINMFGDEVELDRICTIFDKIFEVLGQGDRVSREDIQIYLQQSCEDNICFKSDSDVILKYGKKEIRTRTKSQLDYLNSIRDNDITVCQASPGVGKTMVAVCYGLSLLVNKEIDKIILTRPMVAAKGEADLGALPGTVTEKLSLWTLPMIDVFERVLGKQKLEDYCTRGKIQLMPLGYMRGLSLYRTFLLADEFENSNITLAKLLVTRIGEASKIVVCGDPVQQDNYGVSGLTYLQNALKGLDRVGIINMPDTDIVRHPLIPRLLEAFKKEDIKMDNKKLSSI